MLVSLGASPAGETDAVKRSLRTPPSLTGSLPNSYGVLDDASAKILTASTRSGTSLGPDQERGVHTAG